MQDDGRSKLEVLKSEQATHNNTIEELLREVGMPAGDPCRSDYLDCWPSSGTRKETRRGFS